jgi:hypothetical protein
MAEENREEKVFFGAESYYQWLKAGVLSGDLDVMEQMIRDVNRYAEPELKKWFPQGEWEDVQQELDLALWKQISHYLQGSDHYHPYQRQRWLKTLIQRTIYQHLRTMPQESTSLEGLEEQGYEPVDHGQGEAAMLNSWCSDTLTQIAQAVCAMKISPERMLTFFYHNIVFFLEGDNNCNGKPQETAARLGGKTLGQLRDALPRALEEATGLSLPERVLAPLDRKLEGHRQEIYAATPTEISVSTSNAKKRVAQLGIKT